MRSINNKRGFILVVTLLAACILIAIAIPYVARVATEYKLAAKMRNANLAIDIAEAGVDRAIWEIVYNNSAFPGWTYANNAGNQTWTISNVAFHNTANAAIGYYDVTVYLPTGVLTQTITSTAYVPTKAAPDETKKVVVVYAGGSYHFTNAIAAAGPNPSVTMSGQARTDSFDSSVGPYGSPLQTNTNQGDVQCNGPITLTGQAYINGNANPGPAYPFTGTPNVSGSYATLSAPIAVNPIPTATMTAAQATNSNSNITVTNKQGETTNYGAGTVLSENQEVTLTFPGGTYYFTSINITGKTRIVISGRSLIYVDGGNISMSGQGVFNNGTALDLGIYSTGASVSLSGQAEYVGTIYAPTATVTLTGQENFYGAIVCGSSVDSGQASIHYDLALKNATQTPPNYRATSWMEQ
jgi:hypothetical protein